jgi:co-chaperonin GroES (HSP10)
MNKLKGKKTEFVVVLDKVLVEPIITGDEITSAGLLIPKTNEALAAESKKGKVLNVGDGTAGNPMKVRVGDIAYYPPFAGNTVEDNGKKYTILLQSNILFLKREMNFN